MRYELGSPKFVADPFAREPGARLYASGDIVRYRVDGAIEFLGRADNQVKIRGMRVELEEIEAVLAQHPAIRQAVVLAKKSRLYAYTVAESDTRDVSTEQLRQWSTTHLPDRMVPAEYVLLPTFPLLSSGKVDRKALLARSAPTRPDGSYVPPATDAEKSWSRRSGRRSLEWTGSAPRIISSISADIPCC
ncbi:amino acid adenylation domain-containing protein [Fodinicola feengrottensis]|uniref:amino acid adenylation domain-containing protein n=1 Tax=Fodinicola feengrottensis TaxID=435914 RepID=UPI0013D49A3E|nr:amino acid adenylation domain-containing protein [Fodinicola feengrottensis]